MSLILFFITTLVETIIAYLFGYRNKLFLMGIVVVNICTIWLYEFVFQLKQHEILGLLALFCASFIEIVLLLVLFKKSYTKREIIVLMSVANVVSYVIIYVLGSLFY